MNSGSDIIGIGRINKSLLSVRAFLMAMAFRFFAFPVNALAADSVTSGIKNLGNIIGKIIQGAGAVVLLWGVFEFATAWQQRDSAAQTEALKKVISGLVMIAATAIVQAIV